MSYLVGIVDYGIGNVKSIENAITKLEADPILSGKKEDLLQCEKLVLPGVGAFQNGMKNLIDSGLGDVIKSFVETGKPLLGICLGMQMLFQESEEFGITEGLGLIAGKVKKIPTSKRLPHIGWNSIEPLETKWNQTILESLQPEDKVYFVHTFAAFPEENAENLAQTHYGDVAVCAAAMKENVIGTQFHPEKSGSTGLEILSRFITN